MRFSRIDARNQEKHPIFQEILSNGKLYEVFDRIESILNPILNERHDFYEKILSEEAPKENETVENQDKKENDQTLFEAKALDLNTSKVLWDFWDETQNTYLQDIYKSLNKTKENR